MNKIMRKNKFCLIILLLNIVNCSHDIHNLRPIKHMNNNIYSHPNVNGIIGSKPREL